MAFIEDTTAWIRKNGAPCTVSLIASLVTSGLIFWGTQLKGMERVLLSNSPQTPIWTFFTYPWANWPFGDGLQLIFFACLMFWMFQVGGSVEREIGTPRFAALWFVSTAVAGIVMVIGANICHQQLALAAPYLPESAITIVWCVRNRTASVMMFGFVPLSGFLLGWATVVTDALLYGRSAPLLGGFACFHLAIAALYAMNKLPFLPYGDGGYAMARKATKKEATTRGQVQYDQSYFDEVKRRETERAEQERLRKLLGD